MLYNITPNGNTFLHLLNKRGDVIADIMKIAHGPEKGEIKYHVPFLFNFEQESPMDMFFQAQDFRTMNTVIHYLSYYGYDHHSRVIQDTLPMMLQQGIPELGDYLDSRMLQTEKLSKIKKGCIQTEGEAPDICVSSFWVEQEDIDQVLKKSPIEQDIRMEFIDIPNIHTFREVHSHSKDNISQKFFDCLADTEDMDIFNKQVIRKLIEFKWPLIKEFLIKKLFIPYIMFLATYVFYMNYIYYQRTLGGWYSVAHYSTMALLFILAIYFIMNETRQLCSQGFNYLTSFWNYIDLTPPILLLVFFTLEVCGTFSGGNNPDLEASI